MKLKVKKLQTIEIELPYYFKYTFDDFFIFGKIDADTKLYTIHKNKSTHQYYDFQLSISDYDNTVSYFADEQISSESEYLQVLNEFKNYLSKF